MRTLNDSKLFHWFGLILGILNILYGIVGIFNNVLIPNVLFSLPLGIWITPVAYRELKRVYANKTSC